MLLEPTLSPEAKLALEIEEVGSWSFAIAPEARTVRQDIDLLHLD